MGYSSLPSTAGPGWPRATPCSGRSWGRSARSSSLLVLASLALSFTVVGALALLGATLVGARRLARAERARAGLFFGVTIADPHLPTEGKWWQRVVARATRSETWREVAYLVLLGPISLIGAGLVLAAWTGAAVFLLLPMYNPALANGGAHLFAFVIDTPPASAAVGLVGIGLALAAPWIARGVAGVECRLATSLLGPSERAALATRVDELRARREQLFDVVEAERRRIERDLHDGAQQRLVALAMNLGMAKEKFDKDPAAARALMEEAHREAKQAMVELRNLARGIHPAVLSDRGLDAALSSLAGRAPVPVAVDVQVAATAAGRRRDHRLLRRGRGPDQHRPPLRRQPGGGDRGPHGTGTSPWR